MDILVQVLTILVVLIGTIFSFLGILGMIRMPDVYTRLHATGKVGVFGVAFLLLAAALWTPVSFGKTIVIILLIMLTGPVTTHALASTAYRLELPLQAGMRNDLIQRSPQAAEFADQERPSEAN
jgi:monovalent cation/proton antiporter MnhG/PhaG subunit